MRYVDGGYGGDRARRTTLYTMYHECVRRNRHAHPGRFDRTIRAHHILYYIGRHARASAFIYQSLKPLTSRQ